MSASPLICTHTQAPHVGRTVRDRQPILHSPDVRGGSRPALPGPTCHLRSLPGQRGPLGHALPPRSSGTCPQPSPLGLAGSAGAWRLQACELTLGTELQGTSEPELQGWFSNRSGRPSPCWAGPQTPEEMPDRLSLSVGFRKIPAWKVLCLPPTTVCSLPSRIAHLVEKTTPNKLKRPFSSKENATFPLMMPPRCCQPERESGAEGLLGQSAAAA